MTSEEQQRFNDDFIIKIFHQDTQIKNWVNNLFIVNQKLNEHYDPLYQSCFYTILYELLHEGLKYIVDISISYEWGDSPNKPDKYFETVNEALLKIKSDLSEVDLEVIEYKRHCACHIFQDKYEYNVKGNKLHTQKKGKNLDELRTGIDRLMDKYGGDKGFDEYLTKKTYSEVEALREELERGKIAL